MLFSQGFYRSKSVVCLKATTSRRTPKHACSTFLFVSLLLAFLFLATPGTFLNSVESTDVKSLWKLEAFGRRLAKKNQLKYLNKGKGTLVDSRTVAWDLSLMGNQRLTVEEARPLIVGIIDEFLYMTTKDPLFDAHLKNEKNLHPYAIFSPKRIGIKLAFWDENIDRYSSPHVSQIKAMEGKIYYFQANSCDQSLEEIHQETFEKAFALVEAQE